MLIETKLVEKIKKDQIREKKTFTVKSYPEYKKIVSLIKIISKYLGKQTKFPVADEPMTKSLETAISYVHQILKGGFFKKNLTFDWLYNNGLIIADIEDECSDIDDLIDFVVYKQNNFKYLMDKRYYPADKSMITTLSIDRFIYNPFTHTSWLVYCLFCTPSPVNQTVQAETDYDIEDGMFDDDSDYMDALARYAETHEVNTDELEEPKMTPCLEKLARELLEIL